jgi:hypothetical protein
VTPPDILITVVPWLPVLWGEETELIKEIVDVIVVVTNDMEVTVTIFVPPGLVTRLVDAGSVVTEVVVTKVVETVLVTVIGTGIVVSSLCFRVAGGGVAVTVEIWGCLS